AEVGREVLERDALQLAKEPASVGVRQAVRFVLAGELVPSPLTCWPLEGEQFRAPPLRGNPGPLRRDLVVWCVEQVSLDLPADGGIGVEQPVDDLHVGPPGSAF